MRSTILCTNLLAIVALSSCTFMNRESEKKLDSKAESAQTLQSRANRHIASIEEQMTKLDPKKKNVCTVTLNSTNERNAFQSKLNPKDFNFIELAPTESGEREWFLNACRTGVKCDVVLVSGHFGGTFFGNTSPAKLPLEDLEEYACRSECDGILSHPKEVFLFGCNTLAGKRKDSRTPEEYVRVLVADGFPQAQAEQVAAFRYSPLGTTNEARMTQAFKGAMKIYGFDSRAPLGKVVESAVFNYLRSIKDYSQHLDGLQRNKPNTQLAKALKAHPFVESSGAISVDRSPVCYLNNPRVSAMSKLSWIEGILRTGQGRLENAITIDRYLERLLEKGNSLTDQEYAWFEKMQHLDAAKSEIEQTLLKGLNGMLHAQMALANMMKRLNWWSQEDYSKNVKTILGEKLKANMSGEDRDLLCSLNLKIELSLADLPPEPKKWSPVLLSALSCMRPTDPELHWALFNTMISSKDSMQARIFGEVLGRLESKDSRLHRTLWEKFKTGSAEQSNVVGMALMTMPVSDPQLHQEFLKTFKSSSQTDKAFAAASFLSKAQKPTLEIMKELLSIMKNSTDNGRVFMASVALGPMAPSSDEIQNSLLEMLNSAERSDAAKNALQNVFPRPEWMQQRLFQMVRDSSSEDTRGKASELLSVGRSLPRPILDGVIELLKTSNDTSRKDSAAGILQACAEVDEPTQFALVSLVSPNESETVNYGALSVLRRNVVVSQRVQMALISHLRTLSKDLDRGVAVQALKNARLTNAARQELNKDAAQTADAKLRSYAKEILTEPEH